MSVAHTSPSELNYVWAAYKKGSLDTLHDDFKSHEMSPQELGELFDNYLMVNGLSSFTVHAESDGQIKPIGLITVWARERILQINEMSWFWWASKRNIFEGAVKFFDQVRRTEHQESGRNFKVLEFSSEEDRKFFERMMDLGLLNRCGKIPGLYEDQEAVLFYTVDV